MRTIRPFRDTLDHDDGSPLMLFAQALDRTGDAIAIYTVAECPIASTVVYANRALTELSGYAEEHFVGHSALLLAGAQPDGATVGSILPSSEARELCARTRKQRPDGSTYEVDVEVLALTDPRGVVTHYVSRQREVEERSSPSADLLVQMRGDAFRELSAGVAYEFEALTSRCFVHAAHARAASIRGEHDEQAFGAVERALSSMAATVRSLQAFSTEAEQSPTSLNVHDAIELALRLAGPLVRRCASIERRYTPVRGVMATLPELAQAFTAILRNAGESIPGSPREANHIVVETSQSEACDTTVTISDTGVGIERGDLPFVFDPFFTTKPAATGLGLAAARVYVESIGGTIHVESGIGRGTRVTVTLPSTAPERLSANVPPMVTCETPESRLLSVADTHAAAIEIAEPFTDGHVILVVATWGEAIERLALGGTFDLVIADGRAPLAQDFRERSREVAPDSRVFEVSVARVDDSGVFRNAVPLEAHADSAE